MKPGACIAATIELLDILNSSWEQGMRSPADAVLARYYKTRRYMGSKDRAAISETFYYILRNGAALEWWLEAVKHDYSTRKIVFLALLFMHSLSRSDIESWLENDNYAPEKLTNEEKELLDNYEGKPLIHGDMPEPARLNYPEWMESELKSTFSHNLHHVMRSMGEEAPIFLRANKLKTTRKELIANLQENKIKAVEFPLFDHAVKLEKRGPMFATEAFKNGWFEMQDAGSQMVAELVDAKPGQKVIDFCAGAGGKTLAIAANMENKGRILAWDTSESRLKQMPKRLARSGVDNVQIHNLDSENDSFIKRHKDSADWVLLDVPCTGSGTWRRNPDLKWRTTAKDLHDMTVIQQRILKSACRLVKEGGVLVYATCSFFAQENEQQIDAFLAKHENFEIIPCGVDDKGRADGSNFLSLMPHIHTTDGFFAACLRRA